MLLLYLAGQRTLGPVWLETNLDRRLVIWLSDHLLTLLYQLPHYLERKWTILGIVSCKLLYKGMFRIQSVLIGLFPNGNSFSSTVLETFKCPSATTVCCWPFSQRTPVRQLWRDTQKLCCISTILLAADKPDYNLGHGQACTRDVERNAKP